MYTRRVRLVVADVVLCPFVRLNDRRVVVRPLSVRPVVVVRPLSVRACPSRVPSGVVRPVNVA